MKWLALFPLLLLTTSAPLPPRPVAGAVKPTQYVYYFPQIAANVPANKRGVGMPYAGCDQLAALGIRWAYNWSAETWNCPGVENVPMIWGANALPDLHDSSGWLMGFNEPDQPDQANLSPTDAAIKWQSIEQAYPSRKLVTPAPSHLHPDWLPQFRDTYIATYKQRPRLDALAVHCYLPTATDCIALTQKYEDWAREWNVKEVWLTEFSFVDVTEAQKFIAYLQDDPLVTRFAWFALWYRGWESWSPARASQTPLVDAIGKLTKWGQAYKQWRQ